MIQLYFRCWASEFYSQAHCSVVCDLDKKAVFVCSTYQIEKCKSFVTVLLVLYNVTNCRISYSQARI